MSEFYYNLLSSQIQELIDKKLEIYGNSFTYLKLHDIEISHSSFIYEALINNYAKQGINFNNYKLFRYIGMHEGVEIYHFYNIVSK